MSTFVLVPGFWLGGWAWRDVAPPLRAAGHSVYTPTLTGLGERVHLASPAINLETHIADIVNLIRYEELRDVILLGHSGANVVIDGVAERLPERLTHLVYLDTAALPSGVSVADFSSPEERARNERLVAEQGDGWRLPLPDWASLGEHDLAGLDDAASERMRALAAPQPWATVTDAPTLTNPARAALPKLGILTTFTEADVRGMVASGAPIFAALAEPGWRFIELPTGHWPMFSEPARLADILLDVAAGRL